MKDPFAVAENTVYAPVNKHSEFCILKFPARLEVLGRRLVAGLGNRITVRENDADHKDHSESPYCDGKRPLLRHISFLRISLRPPSLIPQRNSAGFRHHDRYDGGTGVM